MKLAIIVVLICFCALSEASSGVSKCYSCNNDCKNMKVTNCPNTYDYSCMSAYSKGNGNKVEVKTCILTNHKQSQYNCDMINDNGGDCYICHTDLCNSAGIYSVSAILLMGLACLLLYNCIPFLDLLIK